VSTRARSAPTFNRCSIRSRLAVAGPSQPLGLSDTGTPFGRP
jgi:hypothetical protein